jgi:3-oxosteroid 1-dehydrogenase
VTSIEVGFAVVGAGVGGLAAAIVAADAGLRVVIVERSAKLGGVGGVSGGGVWAPLTRYGAAANPDDSARQVRDYLEFVAAGYGTPAHRARFVEAGPDAVHYLADRAGVRWSLVDGHLDNYHPWAPGSVPNCRFLEVEPLPGAELGEWQHRTQRCQFFPAGLTFAEMRVPADAPAPLGGLLAERGAQDARACGEGLLAYLIKAALVDRGIPVLTSTRADSLIVGDGRVIGLRAFGTDGEVTVHASRGVLLATGGYDWNTGDQQEGVPAYGSSCPPTVTGDHLVMAGEIGAEITVLPPVGLHTQLGYTIPGEEYEGAPLWRWALYEAGQRHTIIVNDRAERFCDESWFFHEQSRIREFDPVRRRYTNLPAYLIFDQNHRDRTRFGPYLAGRDLPDEPFVRADTLGGLAAALGLPAEALSETVRRFNGYCAVGRDQDFGRGGKELMTFLYPSPDSGNPVLGPIERGPFYGVELQAGGLGANQAGLRTDDNAVVQHLRGRAIEGLYAVGNAAAHLDFGPSYISGGLIARGLVWAYVAARHAACVTAGITATATSDGGITASATSRGGVGGRR